MLKCPSMVKIVHTADLHLGSPLLRLGENAQKRRNELLLDFFDALSYAQKNADALLICGDLFDSSRVPAALAQSVRDALANAAPLKIYLLGGNHDAFANTGTGALSCLLPLPENVFCGEFYSGAWAQFRLADGVVITMPAGVQTERTAAFAAANPPKLSPNDFNIVMLHGEITQGGAQDSSLNIAPLASLPVDYLALGHRHSYHSRPFARGSLAYSGCLSVRGFDEPEPPAFIEINTQTGEHKKIETDGRRVISARLTVNKDTSNADAVSEARRIAAKVCGTANFFNLIIDGEGKIDTRLLFDALQPAVFALRVDNKVRLPYSLDALAAEHTLRGFFVRRVLAEILPAAERDRVLAFGLAALAGEEPESV